MRTRRRGDRGEPADAAQHLLRESRMELDALPLVVGQAARLVEDRVRDCELADVVQKARAAEVTQSVLVDPEGGRGRNGELGDARRMAVGVGRLRIDDEGKSLGDAIQAVAVGEDLLLGRLLTSAVTARPDEIVRSATDDCQNPRSLPAGARESTSTSAGSRTTYRFARPPPFRRQRRARNLGQRPPWSERAERCGPVEGSPHRTARQDGPCRPSAHQASRSPRPRPPRGKPSIGGDLQRRARSASRSVGVRVLLARRACDAEQVAVGPLTFPTAKPVASDSFDGLTVRSAFLIAISSPP